MPATSTRQKRLTATRTSPEVLRKWRGRESSPGFGPLDSPSRLLLQSVALRVCVGARYSGGAAPAFNRFPWLPSAIDCLAKLSTSQRLRKRQDHRAANHECKSNEVARVDHACVRRHGEIDHCNGVRRYVATEKSPEVTLVDIHRVHFA